MKEVTIIFPHQLFKQHPAVASDRIIYLVEETLFFNQFHFHRQKILLHRASMKVYAGFLSQRGYTVHYIEAIAGLSDIRALLKQLHQENITGIHIADVADNWLNKRMVNTCWQCGIEITAYPSPNFLNTPGDVKNYFDRQKTYFLTDFYIDQRKQQRLLLDAGGKPAGGKWSYDADNRLKFPKTADAPVINFEVENDYIREARQYVLTNFGKNYGDIEKFIYPAGFDSAEKWLEEFLRERFAAFGCYQDAIVSSEHFLHHSVLTPMLNIGLLSPRQIIDRAVAMASGYAVPLNSLEGFIRQVMGWREFVRIVYEREGSKQRTRNYWGFTRKIPAAFWTGHTGIAPIDNTIRKVLKTGYSHHIERLMVMGNFMLLCEFDPDDVYQWFMEMYIDAYDWVMVPNVYAMAQFADGGLMSTKPYISGSNYLLKMSDYKKGPWTETWDGLFWRFMHVHRDFFLQNPRLGMLIKTFDKMPESKKNRHIGNAENYLAMLDKNEDSYLLF